MTSRNDKIVQNLYINHGDKITSTINKAIANNITSSTQQDAKEILKDIKNLNLKMLLQKMKKN